MVSATRVPFRAVSSHPVRPIGAQYQVIFKPRESEYNFHFPADPNDVAKHGPISPLTKSDTRSLNGGLIVTGSALVNIHRDLIITLAARHKLPAVYFEASSSPAAA